MPDDVKDVGLKANSWFLGDEPSGLATADVVVVAYFFGVSGLSGVNEYSGQQTENNLNTYSGDGCSSLLPMA